MADTSRVPLLSVEGLKKYYTAKSGMFSRSAGVVRAVDGVSFQLFEGETLGLVGESGCGKSTLGRQLVGLEHPTGGQVVYDGHDLGHMSQAQMKPFRTQLQMIFQDSYSSLNPRKHVFEILAEPCCIMGWPNAGMYIPVWRSCWIWWGFLRTVWEDIPMNSPADRGSV